MTCAKGFLLLSAAVLAGIVTAGEWPDSSLYSEPKKVVKHLYEIEFTDYEYGCADVYMKRAERVMAELAKAMKAGGCSCVRKDRLIGRNLDWQYSDLDEFLIRVPAGRGRHASIGMAVPIVLVPDQPVPTGTKRIEYDMLPFFTVDGINDAGVFCECNLMPVADEPNDDGTNLDDPAAFRLCEASVVRYVLDYAKSAKHACELLKRVSIRLVDPMPLSWMIADKDDTFVVEVIGNAVNILPRGKAATLTNFYLSKSPVCGRPFSPFATGCERYDRLTNGIERVDSVDGMLALMKSEFYSQMYIEGNEAKWWSEMNETEYEGADGTKTAFMVGDSLDPASFAYKRRMAEFASDRAAFARAREYEKRIGARMATDLWHTIHSAVYDLDGKTIHLRVQEADRVFAYSL